MPPRANSATSTSIGPKIIFHMLGDARQHLLEEDERGGADDRAVERAEPAEDHHDDELARTLPGHEGRADELGLVGEEEAGEARTARRR